jgi:hypothetical protein
MQPFTWNSLYTLLLAAAALLVCYLLFHMHEGFLWMVARSLVFVLLFGSGMFLLKLSPDAGAVWGTIRKKLGF